MTLNRIIAVALRQSTECVSCGANYIAVVKVRTILSATKILLKECSFRQYMIYGEILRNKNALNRGTPTRLVLHFAATSAIAELLF